MRAAAATTAAGLMDPETALGVPGSLKLDVNKTDQGAEIVHWEYTNDDGNLHWGIAFSTEEAIAQAGEHGYRDPSQTVGTTSGRNGP